MKERKLPEGWRMSEEYSVSKQTDYVKKVVEELSAIPRIKRAVPTTWQGKPIEELTQEEREAFHFSMQEPSTKAALTAQKLRKPEDDIDHLLRPMPECLANPEAKSLDELTAKRNLDPTDIALHNQRSLSTTGQSNEAGASKERRTKAIEAFTYSKPANPSEQDLKRLKALTEIISVSPGKAEPYSEDKPKDSLSFRIASWLHYKTGFWWW